MNNVYAVKIVFLHSDNSSDTERFRRILDRSMHGAIAKAFRKARKRTGDGASHKTYSCSKAIVEVQSLGPTNC